MKIIFWEHRNGMLRITTEDPALPEFVYFEDQFNDVIELKNEIEKKIKEIKNNKEKKDEKLKKIKKELEEECQKQT